MKMRIFLYQHFSSQTESSLKKKTKVKCTQEGIICNFHEILLRAAFFTILFFRFFSAFFLPKKSYHSKGAFVVKHTTTHYQNESKELFHQCFQNINLENVMQGV